MYQGVCGKLSWCKWRRHDDTWRRHAHGMVTASRRHCDDMATTRRPYGDGMATALRRHGDDMATMTWRRHGDDAMTTRQGRQRRRWQRRQRRWRGRRRRSRDRVLGYGVDIAIHMAMVWWCRSVFVTTKSFFSYVLSQMGALLSEAGKVKWVFFVCWQHSTWIVFAQWVWDNRRN